MADLLPNQPEVATVAAKPKAVRVEMPSKIARHLHDRDGLGAAERHALRQGRHGAAKGYGLHVTAAPQVHQAPLVAAAPLSTDGAKSAERKAYRIYVERLNNAVIDNLDENQVTVADDDGGSRCAALESGRSRQTQIPHVAAQATISAC